MPKPKQGSPASPETPAVDWAEKLKASISQSPAPSSSALYEDDDLTAMLRAQLSKSTSNIPEETVSAGIPDTSEFDMYDEIFEEFTQNTADTRAASDEVDRMDVVPDKVPDDAADETADDTDEVLDEVPDEVPDEVADETADEYTESGAYNEDRLTYEDDPDYEDDAAYGDSYTENNLYIREGPSEPSTEEILDRAFAEEAAEKVQRHFLSEEDFESLRSAPPPRAAKTPYHPPLTEVWTDDRLNGLRRPDGVGSDRLRHLARENQQLVSESERILESAAEPQPLYEDILMDSPPASAPSSPQAETEHRAASSAPRIYAPLQLGLDDISPTAQASTRASARADARADARAATPTAASDEVHAEGDYTARMSDQAQDLRDLNDTEMVLGLGYEDSLRRTDAQLRVERLAAQTAQNSRIPTFESPSVEADREYSGREDTARVAEDYLRNRHKSIARLLVACMGALVGLFYDLLPAMLAPTDALTVVDTPYYAPVGLVWMLLICLPFVTRLGRGVRSLLNFEPSRYAVSVCALTAALLGGICAWMVGNPYELPLFCGVSLLTLAVAALSELLATVGEARAFSVASSGKALHVLTDEGTPSATALRAVQKRCSDGYTPSGQKIFTVTRTGRVADYFARTARYNPYMGRLNYFLPASLLLAIVCAGIAIATGGSILSDGVRVFETVYLACLPSAYLIAMTLPLCTVNGYLGRKGAAVIGAAAPLDYAPDRPTHLIFPDGDAVKAVRRKDVTLRGDTQSEDCRRMADITFRLLDIPLAREPVLPEDDLGHYRVEISERGDQFLRLYLVDTRKDSSTEIILGSHNALTRQGIRLPKVAMEAKYKKSEASHVLYLAFNRSFHLAYAVEGRVGRTFGRTVATLSELGYAVDIATFDPLFDPDMDGLSRLQKRYRVEVLRPDSLEFLRKGRSSGLIATGRSQDIIYPLNACHAMRKAYRRGNLFAWLCLPAAVAAVVTVVCLGALPLLNAGTVALWQLIGIGATLWISLSSAGRRVLNRESLKDAGRSAKKPKAEPNPKAEP